jgi:hypothetical protein
MGCLIWGGVFECQVCHEGRMQFHFLFFEVLVVGNYTAVNVVILKRMIIKRTRILAATVVML